MSRERNVVGRPKLVGRLSTPQAIMRPRFKGKGQKSRSPGRLMLRPECVIIIFRTGRPTNFKLDTQMEHEDPRQATSAVTSNIKGQGRKVTWCVWQVLADKSRTKRLRKTKIGRKIVHSTSNKAPKIQGLSSKVKVTRPTNAETGSASYHQNGKAYKLQTSYTDGARRPASATSAVTSKVKDQGRGRKVTWCVWQVLADKSSTKRSRNTKIGRTVAHPTGNNAQQFQGQRRSTKTRIADKRRHHAGQLLLRPKLYHIYWTGRPTNFRIGTQVEHALSTVTPSQSCPWVTFSLPDPTHWNVDPTRPAAEANFHDPTRPND